MDFKRTSQVSNKGVKIDFKVEQAKNQNYNVIHFVFLWVVMKNDVVKENFALIWAGNDFHKVIVNILLKLIDDLYRNLKNIFN